MPTFKKADGSVTTLATDLMHRFESHKPLLSQDVRVDIVMASADLNEDGEPINDALRKNGRRTLGITRALSSKDRAMGRGDAEITLDADWWAQALPEEQAALLDHELHHISIKTDRHGNVARDDTHRPLIKLRKHDIEVGWFSLIAQRHGDFSQERIQAKKMMDDQGQYYWPDLAPKLQITAGDKTVTIPPGQLKKLTKNLGLLAKEKAAKV